MTLVIRSIQAKVQLMFDVEYHSFRSSLTLLYFREMTRNEIDGLGHDSALKSYTGPKTSQFLKCRFVARTVDLQSSALSLCVKCPLTVYFYIGISTPFPAISDYPVWLYSVT